MGEAPRHRERLPAEHRCLDVGRVKRRVLERKPSHASAAATRGEFRASPIDRACPVGEGVESGGSSGLGESPAMPSAPARRISNCATAWASMALMALIAAARSTAPSVSANELLDSVKYLVRIDR